MALYALLGALTTAFLALLALPAVSRRALRLAEARARLLTPPSAIEAQAERNVLRGRYAIEMALAERRSAQAMETAATAQAEIGRREAELAERGGEIVRKAKEIEVLSEALRAARAETAAREASLIATLAQRDAAELRAREARDALARAQREHEQWLGQWESRFADGAREIVEMRRRYEDALNFAQVRISDLERRLGQSEAESEAVRRETDDLVRLAGDAEPDDARNALAWLRNRIIEGAARINDLAARLHAQTAAQNEAKAERDAALRELETMLSGDAQLRQEIARLGRALAEGTR